MYSKERAQQIVKKDVKYIPAGIQENVALDSARVGTSPSGRNFIEIKLVKDGATLPRTEWEPRRTDRDTDETFQNKEDKQFSRIMQILLCFYKDEELIFNSNTFKGWAEEVVNYLNKADKTKLVRAKVVYNDRGYTTLPQYATYTFIEPMSVENSAIVELGIDRFTRPVVADQEEPADPISLVTGSENKEDDNDLPF